MKTSVITIPRHCSIQSDVLFIPEIKEKVIKEEETTFEVVTDHPMLQTFSKKNPKHFPGYEYVQDGFDRIGNGLEKFNETLANATATNEKIKEIQSKIVLGTAIGGGALGLVVFLLIVCVCCCYCANRKSLHIPCV